MHKLTLNIWHCEIKTIGSHLLFLASYTHPVSAELYIGFLWQKLGKVFELWQSWMTVEGCVGIIFANFVFEYSSHYDQTFQMTYNQTDIKLKT